ncbi:MAG: hypothetical protein LBV74_21410, partial [Tannerella sp.]|nr:hypothetical protein [Tannerella sp.]
MRKYTFLVFGLLWYISGFSASTPPARYLAFNNLDNKTKALQVRCITQDASGMIWFGTTRGLYSYDGYDVHHHISENTLSRQLIHCCIADQQTLFLGCETGIITFDLTNGKFARPDSTFKENVRALLKYKDKIWIGAETGVYILNAEKKEIRPVDIQSGEMPRSVYSLAADDNYLYVGMMYGAGRYSPDNQEYHKIDFPALIAGAMLLDEA